MCYSKQDMVSVIQYVFDLGTTDWGYLYHTSLEGSKAKDQWTKQDVVEQVMRHLERQFDDVVECSCCHNYVALSKATLQNGQELCEQCVK